MRLTARAIGYQKILTRPDRPACWGASCLPLSNRAIRRSPATRGTRSKLRRINLATINRSSSWLTASCSIQSRRQLPFPRHPIIPIRGSVISKVAAKPRSRRSTRRAGPCISDSALRIPRAEQGSQWRSVGTASPDLLSRCSNMARISMLGPTNFLNAQPGPLFRCSTRSRGVC